MNPIDQIFEDLNGYDLHAAVYEIINYKPTDNIENVRNLARKVKEITKQSLSETIMITQVMILKEFAKRKFDAKY